MATAALTVKLRLVPVQADGTVCAFCSDHVWLRAFRLLFVVGSRPIGEASSLVCQSCGDVLRSSRGASNGATGEKTVEDGPPV